jgi:predicted metalloenzyme YecM
MNNHPKTLDEFYERMSETLTETELFLRTRQVIGLAAIDHIGWTCASNEEFDTVRKLFESGGSTFIYQSLISGRRIAIIGLSKKVETPIGQLCYLELSDLKPGTPALSGFNHIEACPLLSLSYEELVSMLSSRTVVREIVRPHHTTHEASVHDGLRFCCSREPLVQKIKRDEMK